MTDTPPFTPFSPPTAPSAEQPRKRRGRKPKAERAAKTTPKQSSQKYELQTILKATRHLKDGDEVLFGQMVTACSEAPAATRERVLKALKEIFG